ncbi:MAG: hypothetical protein KDA65_14075 [Planctomycetaceae bacterium]|nr:hypothetical protein [Planctomycetaceae bacterium]
MEPQETRHLIPLQPLTITQAIDSAFLTVRMHFRQIYRIVVPFLICACLLVYYLNHFFNLISLILFPIVFLCLGPLGDLLIRRAAHKEWIIPGAITAQGREKIQSEKFSRVFFRALGNQFLLLLLTALLLFPGLFYFRASSFYAERHYLDNPESKIQKRVWKELTKAEAISLEGCLLGLGLFWAFLSGLLFIFIDLSCTLLFSFPIFFMRFEQDAQLVYLLFYDPYVMVTVTAVMLFTFPVIRVAWMFCYISLRVKFDCWDIATSINREAERLRISMDN